MKKDISRLLKSWQYLPNDVNVRIIVGQDGAKKLQMRIDLGLLQMELDGRPDGRRPHRFDSYLSYFENRARAAALRMDAKPFMLSPIDCLHLQQEAIQYYHRYIALMRLNDYARVARDTSRNLRVFDFVRKYAKDRDIIMAFEQYRPYVVMMHVRALASLAIDKKDLDQAVSLIEQGIETIKKIYHRYHTKMARDGVEVELLQEWLDEVRRRKPLSEREKLQALMNRAIEEEAYETAAKLRDRLRKLE